jgi:hypothetical protein
LKYGISDAGEEMEQYSQNFECLLRRLAAASVPWTLEERARFRAVRDFELLKLLSTDRRALATARVALAVFILIRTRSHSLQQ